MCIASDFQMYYRESYVSFNSKPFFVESVNYSREIRNNANADDLDAASFASYLYSDHEAIPESLIFSGTVYSEDGRYETVSVPMGHLDLENPRIGYIKNGDSWTWFTYSPEQCAKKGLTPLRLNVKRFSHDCYWKFFNPTFDNICLDYDLLLNDEKLYYKGVKIGDVQGTSVIIDHKFGILSNYITDKLPEGLCLQLL